jgi:hypothetical protein
MARMFRQQAAVESALGGGGDGRASSRASDPTLAVRSDEGDDDHSTDEEAEGGGIRDGGARGVAADRALHDVSVESKWRGAPSMVLRDELRSAAVLAEHRDAIEAAVAKHMKQYETFSGGGGAAAAAHKAVAEMAARNKASRARLEVEHEKRQLQQWKRSGSRAGTPSRQSHRPGDTNQRQRRTPLSLQSVAAAGTARQEAESLLEEPDYDEHAGDDKPVGNLNSHEGLTLSSGPYDATDDAKVALRRRPLSTDRFVSQVASRLGIGSAAYRKFYRPIAAQRRHDAAVSRAVAQCLAAPYTAAVVRADALGRDTESPTEADDGVVNTPSGFAATEHPSQPGMALSSSAGGMRSHAHGFWCHLHVVSPFHPPIYAKIFVPTATTGAPAVAGPSRGRDGARGGGGGSGAATPTLSLGATQLLAEDWVLALGHADRGGTQIDIRLLPVVQAVLHATEGSLPPSFAARMPLRVASASAAASAAAAAAAASQSVSTASRPLHRPAPSPSLSGLGAFAPPPREWLERSAVPLMRLEQLRTASCRDPSRDGSSNVVIVVDAVTRT